MIAQFDLRGQHTIMLWCCVEIFACWASTQGTVCNACPFFSPEVATCVTSGDPHYYTFDGMTLHFQGECKYSLSVPARQYANLPYFEVSTTVTLNDHVIVWY